MSRSSSNVLLCWVVLALAVARVGDPRVELKDHVERAQALYQAGDYAASVRELQAAYAIRPLPRLLLNIGQAQVKLRLYQTGSSA